jgi:hypothetical protein
LRENQAFVSSYTCLPFCSFPCDKIWIWSLEECKISVAKGRPFVSFDVMVCSVYTLLIIGFVETKRRRQENALVTKGLSRTLKRSRIVILFGDFTHTL